MVERAEQAVEHNVPIARAVEEALRAIYKTRDSGRLGLVLKKLRPEYVGKELALYKLVCKKYGLTPATFPEARWEGTGKIEIDIHSCAISDGSARRDPSCSNWVGPSALA